MASPFWPGDARLPSADTYFTAQALRAGYAVGPIARSDLELAAPPSFSAREVLQRELQQERIREEYLSRELAHNRLLLDQQMRHQQELEAARRVGPTLVPEFRAVERLPVELGFRERLPSPVPRFVDAGIGRRRPGPCSRSPLRERLSAALRPKAMIRKQRPVGRGAAPEREVVAQNESKLPKKASGIKRKAATIEAASDPSQQDESQWSCSLCQVFATSELDLKAHLKGKRHKVMQESRSSQTKVADKAEGSKKANKPLPGKPTPDGKKQSFYCDVCKVKCTSQVMLNSHLNGKKHKEASVIAPLPMKEQKANQVVQKSSLNCDVCNLKCNSELMLNSHLNGKKHKAQLTQHNKAQDGQPVTAVDPKLANDKPVTAEQTITVENMLANNVPVVVSEQCGKDKSLVNVESSGKNGMPVTPAESSTPATATKLKVVVKKARKETAVGKVAVEEPVKTGKVAEVEPVKTGKLKVVVKKARKETAVGKVAVEEAVKTGKVAEVEPVKTGPIDTHVR